jgi:hypothetical protein
MQHLLRWQRPAAVMLAPPPSFMRAPVVFALHTARLVPARNGGLAAQPATLRCRTRCVPQVSELRGCVSRAAQHAHLSSFLSLSLLFPTHSICVCTPRCQRKSSTSTACLRGGRCPWSSRAPSPHARARPPAPAPPPPPHCTTRCGTRGRCLRIARGSPCCRNRLRRC